MSRSSCKIGQLFVCVLALGLACSSSDDPTEPETPQFSQLSGTLGPSGGRLTSSDDRLSITIPPGALGVDTEISITGIDPSGMDPAFGDFAARAVFEMEPADLSLTAPATITYRMAVQAIPRARRDPDDPQEADLLIGATKTDEGPRIPDQWLEYDLGENTEMDIRITIESMQGGPFVLGKVFPVVEGDIDLGRFTAVFTPDPPPYYKGLPAHFMLELGLPAESQLELHDPSFEQDPPSDEIQSDIPNGAPWIPSEVIQIDGYRSSYRWDIGMTPNIIGDIGLWAKIQLSFEFPDPEAIEIPLGPSPQVGVVGMRIRMASRLLDVKPRPEGSSVQIITGMAGLEGLDVAYESEQDPAPLGDPSLPWLYVVGAKEVQYYRLVMDENHVIRSTEFVSSFRLTEMSGVLPVSSGSGEEMTRMLFMNGPAGSWVTYWNPSGNDYGMLGGSIIIPVADAAPYGGVAHSPGFSLVREFTVRFLEHDSDAGRYIPPTTSVAVLEQQQFPGVLSTARSSLVDNQTRAALIVWNGTPGQIWYHARQDSDADGILVGHSQDDPRQIRGAGGFYAISNFASNSLTTFSWDGGPTITGAGTLPVGTGPHGIDVRLLADSTPLVVSTSATDDTYTLSHFTASGGYLKSKTFAAPWSCRGPKHAVFVGRGEKLYVALSGHDSDTVEITPVDLSDFQ